MKDEFDCWLDITRRYFWAMLWRHRDIRFHSASTAMNFEELKLRLPPKIAELHRSLVERQAHINEDYFGGYMPLLEAYEEVKSLAAQIFPGVIFVWPEPVWNDTLSPIAEYAMLVDLAWLFVNELLRLDGDD